MMGRRSGTGDTVLRYLSQHRNIEVHIDDVVAATGLTRTQVSNAVVHLIGGGSVRIDKPRRGWYAYRGSAPASNGGSVVPHKAKAEVIALLADGRLLVSVEGMVYVAHELEIEQ